MKLLFLVPSFNVQYSNCISLNKCLSGECKLRTANNPNESDYTVKFTSKLFLLKKKETKNCIILNQGLKYARHPRARKQVEIT